MKTIIFEMHLHTGFVGAEYNEIGEIEVDDDATSYEIEEQVEEYTREWVYERIDWGFGELTIKDSE